VNVGSGHSVLFSTASEVRFRLVSRVSRLDEEQMDEKQMDEKQMDEKRKQHRLDDLVECTEQRVRPASSQTTVMTAV